MKNSPEQSEEFTRALVVLLCGRGLHRPHRRLFVGRLSQSNQAGIFRFEVIAQVNQFSRALLDDVHIATGAGIKGSANAEFPDCVGGYGPAVV